MRRWLVAGACVLAVAAAGAGVAVGTGGEAAPDAPETIVHDGRITTMGGRGTVQALAIRDGKVIAAGTDGDVRELAGQGTRLIDLDGRRVLPGLIDAHLGGARLGSSECFSRSPRFDALFKRNEALLDVADRAARTPAGRWLFQLGEGWNVAQLDVPGMITRAELDAIAPNHPVYLQAAGLPGGGGQLNRLGLRRLGLGPGSPGVVRDSRRRVTGQVTGEANRRALRAVRRDIARLSLDEQEACTKLFVRELNRRGLTAWNDAGGSYAAVNRLHRAGELDARVRLNLLPGSTANQIGGIGDDALRIGGIGEPALKPGARGVYPPAAYRALLGPLAADGWGFEHGATRRTTQQGLIEAWETVNRRFPITDLRWRMLRPGDGPAEPNIDALARLKELNAGVVPTPTGVTGGASHPPYRRIYGSGTRACLGTDASPYPPFVGLWYAVSGTTSVPNQGGVAPDQRLTREQALEMATRRCAWFMGLDDRIGSLDVGRLADLIVLSDDYFEVPTDRIRTLTSVLTMVGGQVVYGAGRYERLQR